MPDLNSAQMVDLSQFYWIVGALIIMNIGAIGSMLASAGRVIWFFSKLDSRITENTKDVDSAHKKIRTIESKVYELQ